MWAVLPIISISIIVVVKLFSLYAGVGDIHVVEDVNNVNVLPKGARLVYYDAKVGLYRDYHTGNALRRDFNG